MRKPISSDNLDNIADNGIYWYGTEGMPRNVPYQNASVVEVIGSSNVTGERFQRVTRCGVPGKSSWRLLGGGSNGRLAWAESLTNVDYEAQTITNSHGLTITLYTFGSDSTKALKMQDYINKALTVGIEYMFATNTILKSRVNWYHNVLFGGKSKNSICYLSIDTSGNFKITPQATVASGDAMPIMEYYV